MAIYGVFETRYTNVICLNTADDIGGLEFF